MLLPAFEYRRASSLLQAATVLAENPEARPLAGGTDLLVDLRERRRPARLLVDISALPEIQGVGEEGGRLRIGSGTTVGGLLASSLVAARAPALHRAAHDFADYLTRNKATLGGNVANASPGADLVVPLLALDAEVTLAGPSGGRTLPLDAFLLGPRQTVLGPGELVRSVTLPPAGGGQGWYKLGLKRGGAIAVVSVATRVDVDREGRCRSARIALGAVGPRPFRPAEAEAALTGQPFTPAQVARAAELAASAARPISDVRGQADYRKAMVRVLVARALTLAGDTATRGR